MKEKLKKIYNKFYLYLDNDIFKIIFGNILIYLIYILFLFIVSFFLDIKDVNAETISEPINISEVSLNYNYYDKNDKKTHQVNNIELNTGINFVDRYVPSDLNQKLGTFDHYKYGRNFDINFNIDFQNDNWNTIKGSLVLDQAFLNKFEYYDKWFRFANSVNGEKNKFFKCAYKPNETNTMKIDFTCINAKSGYIGLSWAIYEDSMDKLMETCGNEKPWFSWFGMYKDLNYNIQSDVDLEGYGLDGYIEGPTDPKDPTKTNTFLDNFPSIFDKDNNYLLQLFTIPYNLFIKITNSFNGTCKVYNIGSIKGKNISLPCIDVKNIIGSNLYNIIDIIFCSIIAINLIQSIGLIFNNLISLNGEFEKQTNIKIFK